MGHSTFLVKYQNGTKRDTNKAYKDLLMLIG